MEIFKHKRQVYLFLSLILLYAFLIRLPQLDFPSIGYHNNKENEYISMAKNMLYTKDYINRNVSFYNTFDNKLYFELYPQVPFVSYQILLGYKLFGDHLWFPRLINIFFMILSLLVIFYLVYELTSEYAFSLFGTLILSILPLGVYFARNLQQEAGAFLFLCLGNLLFVKFIKDFTRRYLFGLAICLFMVTAYKFSFLFGLFGLFLIFPYKKYFTAKRVNEICTDILLLISPLLILLFYWFQTGQIACFQSTQRINLLRIFTIPYWKANGRMIWHYAIRENFTFTYFVLFVGGLIKVWLNFKHDDSLLARYIRASSPMIIPYFMIFSDYVNQHNYYQIPFLITFVLAILYCIKEISNYLTDCLKAQERPIIFLIATVLALLFAIPAVKTAINSHFDTIFAGGDVVGRLLKERTDKQERFFIYTFSQGYAPCVYAERKCGWVGSLKEFKTSEEMYKIRYLVVYPYIFLNNMKEDIRKYVEANFHVKFIGYSENICGLFPNFIVLEKGGKLNIDEFINKNKKNLKLMTNYYTVNKVVPFYIMEATP